MFCVVFELWFEQLLVNKDVPRPASLASVSVQTAQVLAARRGLATLHHLQITACLISCLLCV